MSGKAKALIGGLTAAVMVAGGGAAWAVNSAYTKEETINAVSDNALEECVNEGTEKIHDKYEDFTLNSGMLAYGIDAGNYSIS